MAAAFGAVPGAVFDGDVLAHVGAPLREQRALADGTAIVPLASRTVLTVSGPDRLSWLDSITSQALTGLPPGESSELLVLDPHGHVEHAAAVVDDGERAWLVVDRSHADALRTWLTRMRFRLRVDVEDASATHRIVGGASAAALALRAAAVWRDPWPGVSSGGWGYALAEPHPGAAYDWAEAIVEVAEFDRLGAGLGAGAGGVGAPAVAGELAAEALRIAAWRPRAVTEADGRTLPHEVDWLRTAVHLEKGCYRGQETVAKVHNLGHPPRRLVALQLDGSDAILPAAGAEVSLDGEPVGAVTSVARHHDEGPIALALVKRTLPTDAAVTVATDGGVVAAAQETIVPPDAGRTAAVPRLPRLSRRR